jgi:Mg-chelatase subunit ChlD
LLRDWHGQPHVLQTILNAHPRGESSSAAEQTLKKSAQALAPLAGTKAIVLITDAATTRDPTMWPEMETVRPRIFSVGIAGTRAADEEQDRFQDWSSVNGGYYTHLVYDGEMEVAFDRAATMLRRPAGYTLAVETGFREAPGPGSLTVKRGDAAAAGSGVAAVELILDASGSMLQRMDGKRRIAIAKEVLAETVQKHIPVGTPVALRVFGHEEPNACRSDLEMPLAPLDPAAAVKVIDGIQAMNLARTPIADSLAAVQNDLKGASGRVAIVIVTDGEETCEGDPGKVIEALQEKGFEISLNIVGFAIDDAELAAQFESWAQLGGGRYFSANDQGGLSAALEEALRLPFTVYDQGGNEVATGQVGGAAVELEQGFYRVVVNTAPPRTFDNVEVQGEGQAILVLD